MVRVTAKEKIVESALRLFRADGYLNTSVDEIIADAGVSKGSFYHAFKSKELLGLEAIEHYLRHVSQVLRDGPYIDIQDPLERAIAYVQHTESKVDELWCNGCMMGNFTVDLARDHPLVRAKLCKMFTYTEEQLARLFDPVVTQYNNSHAENYPLSGQQLARHYMSVVQGAILIGQAYGDFQVTRDCIRNFRHYLESLRPT